MTAMMCAGLLGSAAWEFEGLPASENCFGLLNADNIVDDSSI